MEGYVTPLQRRLCQPAAPPRGRWRDLYLVTRRFTTRSTRPFGRSTTRTSEGIACASTTWSASRFLQIVTAFTPLIPERAHVEYSRDQFSPGPGQSLRPRPHRGDDREDERGDPTSPLLHFPATPTPRS